MFRDTIAGQNGNGYTESGEIIEILPLVKNYWGPSDDVRVGIAFAQYEDTSKADILVAEAALGSVSAYATLQNLDGGLQIQIGRERQQQRGHSIRCQRVVRA